ncbi:MAG: carboxypeptidase regulatory-like domain-containing protein [Planctomycetes bacterium]|nr:carboxypeptidase regulatory-like domain-containing protein [Planctomycetota bacterium]
MHSRVLATFVIVLLAFVACAAWWTQRERARGFSVLVASAAPSAATDPVHELAPVSASADGAASIENSQRLPITRRPQSAVEAVTGAAAERAPRTSAAYEPPATLVLLLYDAQGRRLFDGLPDSDREAAEALRPVFLEECPVVGQDLPPSARYLSSRTRHSPDVATGRWTVAEFKPPQSGCACAVLGNRVLDAVPFASGQAQVGLHVAMQDLRAARGGLELSVVDDATEFPIRGALVSHQPPVGRARSLLTDAVGRVRFEDLLVGDAQLTVSMQDFVPKSRHTLVVQGTTADAGEVRLIRCVAKDGTTSVRESRATR